MDVNQLREHVAYLQDEVNGQKEIIATLQKMVDRAEAPLGRLSKDLRKASALIKRREARYLVNTYYQIQDFRIASASQIRAMGDEPCNVLNWINDNMDLIEGDIQRALGVFSQNYRVGQWLQSICGIGPVISAGMLAHLDVRKCKTAGHFWSFAGLDPTKKWEKGKKRPWNAFLKTLVVFKAGESFVKVQNNKNDFYGKHFVVQKQKLTALNEAKAFEETAKAVLEAKKFNKDTDAYKAYIEGFLPKAHIHAMARRWAAKLFLSHVHHVMYEDYFGEPPMMPYVFTHSREDHRHYIAPPNWPNADLGGTSLKTLLDD